MLLYFHCLYDGIFINFWNCLYTQCSLQPFEIHFQASTCVFAVWVLVLISKKNAARAHTDRKDQKQDQARLIDAIKSIKKVKCLVLVWGFSAHDFNTQSGGALRLPLLDSEQRSESIFGIQSAPRFQAKYGVESVPRFQPIFGIQSAPWLWSSKH